MDDRDRLHFGLALTKLGAAMQVEVSEMTEGVYWETLADLPAVAVSAALKRATRDCEAFPKPVEVRRLARRVLSDIEAREACEVASNARLPFQRYTFMLALLADPEVPAWKKEKAKADWAAENPGEPVP